MVFLLNNIHDTFFFFFYKIRVVYVSSLGSFLNQNYIMFCFTFIPINLSCKTYRLFISYKKLKKKSICPTLVILFVSVVNDYDSSTTKMFHRKLAFNYHLSNTHIQFVSHLNNEYLKEIKKYK